MYLKADFDLSTLALVTRMTNKTSKTLITLGNIFPICFSLMKKWIGTETSVVLFHLHNIVSIVSIPVEKLIDLEGLYFNILIQSLHLLCVVLSC